MSTAIKVMLNGVETTEGEGPFRLTGPLGEAELFICEIDDDFGLLDDEIYYGHMWMPGMDYPFNIGDTDDLRYRDGVIDAAVDCYESACRWLVSRAAELPQG